MEQKPERCTRPPMVGSGLETDLPQIPATQKIPGIPGAVQARIVYDPTLRRAAAESVRVDRSGLGDEVTITLLRDIRVQRIVQWAAVRVVRIDGGWGTPESYGEYIKRLRTEEERSEEQNLREAVRLYRLESVINGGPLKLVSEELGVSISTATRMMNRARVAGLVDEETGREVCIQAREQQLRDQATGPVGWPGVIRARGRPLSTEFRLSGAPC